MPTQATLYAEDTTHFEEVGTIFNNLQRKYPRTSRLSQADLETYSPYFRRYLAAPCRILGLRDTSVAPAIGCWTRYTIKRGYHSGCLQAVHETQGVRQLALKLWRDRNCVVPSVVPDWQACEAWFQKIDEAALRYFGSWRGVMRHVNPYLNNGHSGPDHDNRIRRKDSTPRQHEPVPGGLMQRAKRFIRRLISFIARKIDGKIDKWLGIDGVPAPPAK